MGGQLTQLAGTGVDIAASLCVGTAGVKLTGPSYLSGIASACMPCADRATWTGIFRGEDDRIFSQALLLWFGSCRAIVLSRYTTCAHAWRACFDT